MLETSVLKSFYAVSSPYKLFVDTVNLKPQLTYGPTTATTGSKPQSTSSVISYKRLVCIEKRGLRSVACTLCIATKG